MNKRQAIGDVKKLRKDLVKYEMRASQLLASAEALQARMLAIEREARHVVVLACQCISGNPAQTAQRITTARVLCDRALNVAAAMRPEIRSLEKAINKTREIIGETQILERY